MYKSTLNSPYHNHYTHPRVNHTWDLEVTHLHTSLYLPAQHTQPQPSLFSFAQDVCRHTNLPNTTLRPKKCHSQCQILDLSKVEGANCYIGLIEQVKHTKTSASWIFRHLPRVYVCSPARREHVIATSSATENNTSNENVTN